jgi:NAD(P)-dependent dehydrogenase (short-subunit alcohol dehydrogenase family)
MTVALGLTACPGSLSHSGPFYTPLQPAARPESQMEGFAAGGPPLVNRAGQPAECGPAYVYLASSDSGFVSGTCLALTGGDMPFV